MFVRAGVLRCAVVCVCGGCGSVVLGVGVACVCALSGGVSCVLSEDVFCAVCCENCCDVFVCAEGMNEDARVCAECSDVLGVRNVFTEDEYSGESCANWL